jgi:hypothetical protein
MSSSVDNKVDIFDVKKTPEIYPMTSMQETIEYFHEKMNQLNKRAYENSAMLQRLAEQVQQLSTRTHKTKASTQKEEPSVDDLCAAPPQPEPKAPVQAVQTEKPDVLSMLLRRFSSEPACAPYLASLSKPVQEPPPEPEPEPESEIQPERPEKESLQFRRFSEQQLEAVKHQFPRRFSLDELGSVEEPDNEARLDPDSEQDLSPCLWQRLAAKFESQEELESEPVRELDAEPPTPKRAYASACGLKRRSLCMLPPDEMHDVLAVISPTTPAPSPAVGDAAEDRALFLR